MKSRRFGAPIVTLIGFTLPLLTTTAAQGADKQPAQADREQWTPLFDGKSLRGWRQVNGTATYAVEDGAIVGTTRAGSPNSFLATEKTYADFVLEFDLRQDAVANSGVQFRSHSIPSVENGRVHGYQIEVDPSERKWTGTIYEEARRGWLYPGTLNPPSLELYKLGEWNHFRVEAVGSSLRTWVNGSPVVDLIDDVTKEGFIALQVHSVSKEEEAGRRTYWKNLRIRETHANTAKPGPLYIRNTRPNDLDEREKAQGWRLLWDGKSTNGWRAASGAAFPSSDWKIENGELIVTSGVPGADIVTEESFAAFELQLEFKLTQGANSGIKYLLTPENGALEYQLLDDERHPDAKTGVDGNRTLASLYDLIPRAKLMGNLGIAPKIGEWQHARIVVHFDNRVEHWLNGVKVLEYVRGSPDFRARVERSKFKDIPGYGEAARGQILLQDHGDEVHFRSIKIRGL